MTPKEKDEIQKVVQDSIPPRTSGRILLAPRVGKTKVMINLIKRDKYQSILWVTPSAELAEVDIPNEFTKWKATRYLKNLRTTTWASLNKIQGDFDLIVLDEEQSITELNSTNLINKTLACNVLLSMTGTDTKHDNKKEIYRSLGLSILYTLNINKAVNTGILSNYVINVVELNLSEVKNITAGTKDKPFLTSEKLQYEYLSKTVNQAMFQKRKDLSFRLMERLRFIKNSKSKFEAVKKVLEITEGRKLIFASSIDNAEKLCENTYHSKTDNSDLLKFQSEEVNQIAMVNAGGVGFTYKKLDHLILQQCDSDKNGLTSQKIARTLLDQKDYKATIWLFSLLGTQDSVWVNHVLNNFDRSKVNYINFKNIDSAQDFTNSGDNLYMFKKHGVKTIEIGNKKYDI